MALANPALLARMQLLPAERMLAAVDPGYSFFSVTGLLDSNLNNGTLRFVSHDADAPAGVVYGDALADLFYDAPPVKEFRKKYKLTKLGATKYLLQALLKAYKDFGGKQKTPRIAIVEYRPPSQSAEFSEYAALADYFSREGYPDRDHLPARSARIPRRGSAAGRIRHRHCLPPDQAPGVSGPVRSVPPAGARIQGARRMHGEQLPLRAGSQESLV